jgi:integrase
MPFYEDRVEYFGGALVLFKRNLAVAVPNAKSHRKQAWYMRLKIGGRKGYITRSTKLTTYEDAYEYAKNELLRLQHAAKLGHSLDDYTFEKHWNDWFERNKKNGTWTASRQYWHEKYAARYFKPYFQNKDGTSVLLNEITPSVASGYWDWRITYWASDEGVRLQKYNPKRRGAKTSSTNNAKKAPAAKTLLMEQSALHQIFYDAFERGRMQQVFKMRAPTKNNKPTRRAGFDAEEYNTLTRYLRSYKDCVGVFADKRLNAWHKLQRQQMYYFVLFLANSGLRVGEAREMIWSDVKFDVAVEGSDSVIAEVRVSKETKKGQARFVQTQPSANETLKRWRETSPYNKTNDLVWFGQVNAETRTVQKFVDLNRGFQQFLQRVPYNERKDGLLYDRDGDKRSLYSLRHTYATLRLEKGDVSVYDLAMNMGCKVAQIENHYSHLVSKKRRHEITKTKRATKPVVQEADDAEDSFVVEALKRFKRGELSETALLEIMKTQQ